MKKILFIFAILLSMNVSYGKPLLYDDTDEHVMIDKIIEDIVEDILKIISTIIEADI